MSARRIILLRHCPAEGHADDAPLTPDGHRAAGSLVPALTALGVDAIHASPARRTVESVAPFARATGLAVRRDPRLGERRLSSPPPEDWLPHVARSFKDPRYRAAPDGESVEDVWRRAEAALGEIRQSQAATPLIVSHGLWLTAALSRLGRAVDFASWRAMPRPSLFIADAAGWRPLEQAA